MLFWVVRERAKLCRSLWVYSVLRMLDGLGKRKIGGVLGRVGGEGGIGGRRFHLTASIFILGVSHEVFVQFAESVLACALNFDDSSPPLSPVNF